MSNWCRYEALYSRWSMLVDIDSRVFVICMMTSSMETFSALLALCTGNSPVSGWFSAQRPVTRSFHVFFDLRLNKRLSQQSWGWWFKTLSRSLWRHCNGVVMFWIKYICTTAITRLLSILPYVSNWIVNKVAINNFNPNQVMTVNRLYSVG